jgi:hypothetical protein
MGVYKFLKEIVIVSRVRLLENPIFIASILK